jgi:3-phosphoshikimate 1-carboxyvinyltransferase
VIQPLPDTLAIIPFARPARGRVSVPGSKSLTNRAMLMASLGKGPVTLAGALFSEDTQIMAGALRRLGFKVEENPAEREIRVTGQGGEVPAAEAELFTGLAGTAARFLTALCASSRRGTYRLDGVPQMRRRPMKGLIDALRSLGAEIRCLGEEGFMPIEIRAQRLRGGPVAIDARESSQMLSALLMVAPLAREAVSITSVGGVRMPFVRMTLRQMGQFGVPIGSLDAPEGTVDIPPASYTPPLTYAVEADATTASYFAALPLVTGGALAVDGLVPGPGSLQGDIGFLDVLAECGAKVTASDEGIRVALEPGAPLRGVSRDFSGFSDTFLTLAALSPLLKGPTRIHGIAHTRKQETDRVAAMAKELKRLGQEVIETEDSLEIRPAPLRPGTTVTTHGDHRFAMSFGVLGCRDLRGDGKPWLSVADPGCCAKTFPGFFELLEEVRLNSSKP